MLNVNNAVTKRKKKGNAGVFVYAYIHVYALTLLIDFVNAKTRL